MYKTYKGIWISCNRFLIENGPEIRIEPYKNLREKYTSMLPMDCYVLLELPLNIVKDIVII